MSSMNYKGYTARVEFSEDDGVFWGKVLGLPASTSISFEGETVAKLRQDFHNAVDFYVADCAKTGKEAWDRLQAFSDLAVAETSRKREMRPSWRRSSAACPVASIRRLPPS